MKVGDLVRDIKIHPHWNPEGALGNRLGVIQGRQRFRYEVSWIDKGTDRFVNKRDLEVLSESR